MDHTTAAVDHTTAAVDHTTAAVGHTTAAVGHTTAAVGHTTAAVGHTAVGCISFKFCNHILCCYFQPIMIFLQVYTLDVRNSSAVRQAVYNIISRKNTQSFIPHEFTEQVRNDRDIDHNLLSLVSGMN